MKTIFTRLATSASFLIGTLSGIAQADLTPGFNYSYNPPGADGIITGITVDVCNNESSSASSFYVAMYLYNQSNSDFFKIGETQISSLSGNSCVTISNWDIDINNTSGIPAGTYRLGVWADSQEEISETDESNNAGLLSGNINYSPSAIGLATQSNAAEILTEVVPNPVSDFASISFYSPNGGKASITVLNSLGQEMIFVAEENVSAGKHTYRTDLSSLPAGIYFYRIRLNDAVTSRRLIKQ